MPNPAIIRPQVAGYLAAEDCDEAEVLALMSSADDELMHSLLDMHEQQKHPGQAKSARL